MATPLIGAERVLRHEDALDELAVPPFVRDGVERALRQLFFMNPLLERPPLLSAPHAVGQPERLRFGARASPAELGGVRHEDFLFEPHLLLLLLLRPALLLQETRHPWHLLQGGAPRLL